MIRVGRITYQNGKKIIPSYDGYEVNIKRLGAGTVHITGSTGVIAIDGSATFDLPSQYSSVTLVATGSQFVII